MCNSALQNRASVRLCAGSGLCAVDGSVDSRVIASPVMKSAAVALSYTQSGCMILFWKQSTPKCLFCLKSKI